MIYGQFKDALITLDLSKDISRTRYVFYRWCGLVLSTLSFSPPRLLRDISYIATSLRNAIIIYEFPIEDLTHWIESRSPSKQSNPHESSPHSTISTSLLPQSTDSFSFTENPQLSPRQSFSSLDSAHEDMPSRTETRPIS
jgi:hypothetical protein